MLTLKERAELLITEVDKLSRGFWHDGYGVPFEEAARSEITEVVISHLEAVAADVRDSIGKLTIALKDLLKNAIREAGLYESPFTYLWQKEWDGFEKVALEWLTSVPLSKSAALNQDFAEGDAAFLEACKQALAKRTKSADAKKAE